MPGSQRASCGRQNQGANAMSKHWGSLWPSLFLLRLRFLRIFDHMIYSSSVLLGHRHFYSPFQILVHPQSTLSTYYRDQYFRQPVLSPSDWFPQLSAHFTMYLYPARSSSLSLPCLQSFVTICRRACPDFFAPVTAYWHLVLLTPCNSSVYKLLPISEPCPHLPSPKAALPSPIVSPPLLWAIHFTSSTVRSTVRHGYKPAPNIPANKAESTSSFMEWGGRDLLLDRVKRT